MSHRWATIALAAAGALPGADVGGSDFGGSPNLVGAGPRAAAMGNAFIAVADDATANTWNPAGMTQLERPEAALSLGLYYRQTDSDTSRQDDDRSDLDLDHVSAVIPFFALDAQQSIGLAWQRRLDFTRRTGYETSQTLLFGSGTIVNQQEVGADQEGSYSSLSLSYAVEPLPGLSFGFTASTWDDDLTANSGYDIDVSSTTTSSFFDLSGILTAQNVTDFSESTTVTVDSGYDIVFGTLWRVNATWNLALVYKPAVELDLRHEVRGREVVTDTFTNTVTSTNEYAFGFDSTLQLPPSLAIGTAWRHDDRITLSADATWTDWSQLEAQDDTGRTVSPINSNLDPDDFDAGWAIRFGYEQVFTLPRLVLIARAGAFYEGLPATTTADSPATAGEVDATIDDWYGLTGGGSIYLRRVLYDVSVTYRRADDVGSSTETVAFDTVDVDSIAVRGGVTVQF